MQKKEAVFDIYGQATARATWLASACCGLVVVCCGLVLLNFRTLNLMRQWKPPVVGIDESGRARELGTGDFTPQAREIYYYLSQFCEDYYSRNRDDIRQKLPRSLLFLDKPLADAKRMEWSTGKTIERFLSDSTQPNVEVKVKRVFVRVEPTASTGGLAEIDFELRYGPNHPAELFTDTVSLALAPNLGVMEGYRDVNPLGLLITHLEEARDFQESSE